MPEGLGFDPDEKEWGRNRIWDNRFLVLARDISLWSKDPSTKCGAVIIRPDRTLASIGYNGFPRGVPDIEEHLSDREEKYPRVVHAELNAILNAREPLHGCTLYQFPGQSCSNCAAAIIQSGIRRVVNPHSEGHGDQWSKSQAIGLEMFSHAGVSYDPMDIPDRE